jgi:hypothetical protein
MVEWWNGIDKANRITRRKTCAITTLCKANPTWTDPDNRDERPVPDPRHGLGLVLVGSLV